MEATIEVSPKLVPVFQPARGEVLYRGMHGGRGGGKSYPAALMAAVYGFAEPIRILCAREFQASIKESFHAELINAIQSRPWLADHYDIGVDYLRSKDRKTEFLFRGLRNNHQSVKSLAQIDLTIVEEAEDVPEASWLALEATVFRTEKSELWPLWNPRTKGSPVDKRFIQTPPDRSVTAEVNWSDNPWFPPALNELRKREQQRLDPATYAHVWEGAYLENSHAQVFAGKVEVRDFEPGDGWDGPYCGGDFGFSQDPTAAVEVWIKDSEIFIRREALKVGLELDHTVDFVTDRIPAFKDHVSRWDSARPESISHMQRHGMRRATACKKGKGSVEDGIAFLRSFARIVIHPECTEAQKEARLYSYKVDRLTGDVTPNIVDANNHVWDAVRYAVEPIMRARAAPSIKRL